MRVSNQNHTPLGTGLTSSLTGVLKHQWPEFCSYYVLIEVQRRE